MLDIQKDAIIDAPKLEYLLTARKRDDKSRFLRRLGFASNSPRVLEAAIRLHASAGEALMDDQDVYGDRLVVVAELIGPTNSRLVRSVWIRRTGEKTVRFVTLYPVKEAS